MNNEDRNENIMERLERLPENQGWNEYDYLMHEALYLARQGRKNLPSLERDFHVAISRMRMEWIRSARMESFDEVFQAITNYPIALRAAMDASDVANENLHRAQTIRRVDALERNIKSKAGVK